ncbi:MAG: UDP-N-acetylmuramate dehydrogenase [Brumimicrobium sp.]|nr:UDP-N-acetylmuramate dehydrogenase [Brumimicrobium sp.]
MKQYKDFDLTNFNAYRIQAIGKEVFFPDNKQEIINLYQERKDYLLFGSGHNLILSKEYYEKPIIIFNGNYSEIRLLENDVIEVEAGAFTKQVCEFALDKELSGLEMFYDIPSSIGGAVIMNAGSSGEEIKDILIKVKYLDLLDMQVKEMLNKDICFEYRNSFFQKNTDKIILRCWLQLTKGLRNDIVEKMETIKEKRWAKQPRNYPNCGSVFKRPKGHYVGALMDELNLKGYTVGGAKISEKHGGFIINFNNASGKDILDIIVEVKRQVKEKFNIDLEVEQRVI